MLGIVKVGATPPDMYQGLSRDAMPVFLQLRLISYVHI